MIKAPFKISTNIPLWSLITVVIGGIIAFTTISAQTATNTKNIIDLQSGQEKTINTLTDLRIAAGQTQASLGALQSDVSFIKQRVK